MEELGGKYEEDLRTSSRALSISVGSLDTSPLGPVARVSAFVGEDSSRPAVLLFLSSPLLSSPPPPPPPRPPIVPHNGAGAGAGGPLSRVDRSRWRSTIGRWPLREAAKLAGQVVLPIAGIGASEVAASFLGVAMSVARQAEAKLHLGLPSLTNGLGSLLLPGERIIARCAGLHCRDYLPRVGAHWVPNRRCGDQNTPNGFRVTSSPGIQERICLLRISPR
jgi:hypothetical protein